MAAPLTVENREVAKREFLLSFRKLGTVAAAAEQVGIDRSTFYRWLDSDPEFADDFHDARDDVIDSVEQTLVQRARNGSELCIFFFLKRWRPEYRDRVSFDPELLREEIAERLKRGIDPKRLFARFGAGDAPELKLLDGPKGDDTN